MNLYQLKANKQKTSKRLGRGAGSGRGHTSGRGNKGQRSRSGFNMPKRFEGGQTSLIQRLPKKGGFRSKRIKPAVINLDTLDKKYKDGDVVSLGTLKKKHIIKPDVQKVKILGRGKLGKKLEFKDCLMSQSVAKAISYNP